MSLRRLQHLVAVFLLTGGLVHAELPQHIPVCDDNAEWPPYTYLPLVHGKKSAWPTGYAVEYLQRILSARKVHFTLDLIPWRRCLREVERGQYALLLNSADNAERERSYLVAKPYYATTLVYFFDQARSKPVINTAADLHKLHLCGVRDYNYAAFGLSASDMDTEADSPVSALLKMKKGRCDAVPERLEVVLGYQSMGAISLQARAIGYERVPGLAPSTFHMMVSRNLPYSAELLSVLNEGIDEMNKSGVATELAIKYGLFSTDNHPQ